MPFRNTKSIITSGQLEIEGKINAEVDGTTLKPLLISGLNPDGNNTPLFCTPDGYLVTKRLSKPFDFSNDIATADEVSYYIDTEDYMYWSLLSTSTAGATIEIKLYASNDYTTPVSGRNYIDISTDIVGGTVLNLTDAKNEIIIVDTPIIFNSYKITFNSDNAATWTAKGKQAIS